MHGVETPTRRADSNPAMNCRAKHILIPPIPAINRWTMHGVETPTRRADSNPAMNCRAKHILIPPIPAFQRRDENPHPTGDLSPCLARRFNAGLGIASPIHRGFNPNNCPLSILNCPLLKVPHCSTLSPNPSPVSYSKHTQQSGGVDRPAHRDYRVHPVRLAHPARRVRRDNPGRG